MWEENRNSYAFFLNYSKDVMKFNLDFLLANCKDVFVSCVELLNDVTNLERWISPVQDKRDMMISRYLMYPMMINVVYPNLQFVIIGILLGAMPQTIYTLRTALEAVGISLYADNDIAFKELDLEQKIQHRRIINARLIRIKNNLIRIAQEIIGKEQAEKYINYTLSLYNVLSAWIHPIASVWRIKEREKEAFPAGLLTAIALTTEKHGVPPPYGILIPSEYDETAMEDLNYLGQMIECTRLSVAMLIYIWSRDKEVSDKDSIERFLEKLLTNFRG